MNGSNNRRGKLHAVPQPTFDSNQVPPHDEERELALLGAILTNGQVADLIVDLVKPADFYDGARGLIFDAMMSFRHVVAERSRDVDAYRRSNGYRKAGQRIPCARRRRRARQTNRIEIQTPSFYSRMPSHCGGSHGRRWRRV